MHECRFDFTVGLKRVVGKQNFNWLKLGHMAYKPLICLSKWRTKKYLLPMLNAILDIFFVRLRGYKHSVIVFIGDILDAIWMLEC